MNWKDVGNLIALIGIVASAVFAYVNLRRDIEELRTLQKSKDLFVGGVVLSIDSCPSRDQGFIDVTDNFDGRYIISSSKVNGAVFVRDGDGAHEHSDEQGEHTHEVTGRTGKLGGGERYGSNGRNAAHKDNTTTITGIAHSDGSGHNHTAGFHEHMSVGFRLCRFVGQG